MWIENGEWTKEIGKCEETTNNESNSSSSSSSSSSDNSSEDTIAPIITLNGESSINLNIDEIYTEEGAMATDDVDGDVAIVISGSVDTSTAGTYTITYTATDTAGNSATPVIRTVNVGDVITSSEPPALEPESQPEAGQPSAETPTPEPEP